MCNNVEVMSSGIFCDCTCDHICTLKRNKTHIRLSIKINIKKINKQTKQKNIKTSKICMKFYNFVGVDVALIVWQMDLPLPM